MATTAHLIFRNFISRGGEWNNNNNKKKKSLNQKRFVKLRTASPSPISFFRKCPLFLIVCEDVLLNSTHCLRQNKTNKKALNKQQFFCPSKSERERDHKHADWRCIGGMNMAVAVHTASRWALCVCAHTAQHWHLFWHLAMGKRAGNEEPLALIVLEGAGGYKHYGRDRWCLWSYKGALSVCVCVCFCLRSLKGSIFLTWELSLDL